VTAARRGAADASRIVATRGLRGFGDGLVSVLLADYLTRLGMTPLEVGAIVTGTLLGSAAVTMGVGLLGARVDLRRVLLAAALLMAVTGLGFASLTRFWPLLAVAVVGTLNPSAGDVSLFLPTEQAVLAHATPAAGRTRAFAWYNLAGALAVGLGALASGAPALVAEATGGSVVGAERMAFAVYAALALAIALVYRGLARTAVALRPRGAPLARSRRIVLELAALFSLDAFGGGFVVQSLLVLWLSRRFGLAPGTMASVFFAAGLLGAFSQLASARLAARIGLVRTMVYTHLPANALLVAAGVVPSAPLAVAFLLLRAACASMDVPARQAYVMAVVPPEERAAAASVTNVPRSLASALPPLLAGLMLERTAFGWPLVCCGVLKAVYDGLILVRFRDVPPGLE